MRAKDSPYHDSRGLQILQSLSTRNTSAMPNLRLPSGVDIEDRPMPPLRPRSKILCSLQREKQRFFHELPIIDEQEFVDLCRAVYFTTEPHPLSTWITVNLGLYYLFRGLQSRHYMEIEVGSEVVDEYLQMSSSNADAAAGSLNLCLEPSVWTCSALIMLVRVRSAPSEIFTHTLDAAARSEAALKRPKSSAKDS